MAKTDAGPEDARKTVDLRMPDWAGGAPPSSSTGPVAMPHTVSRGAHLDFQKVVASGGYADVHTAEDQHLRRRVAVKMLRDGEGNDDAIERLRFYEEAQITAQLDHPNIPPVHEVGVMPDGRHFFTMQFVRGWTFADAMGDGGVASGNTLMEGLKIFLRVCEAVAFAHSKGILHRDIKPENVMVGRHGQVYLMDWGIAQVVGQARPSEADTQETAQVSLDHLQPEEPGTVVGTPAWMAPEQARGAAVDERTDIYALGGLLYWLLTGKAPHQSTTMAKELKLARDGSVQPPQLVITDRPLPSELCRIALKALRPEPHFRYQAVEALMTDVDAFMRGGAWFTSVEFEPGQLIVKEGDHADAAYVLTSGRCEVVKERDGVEQRVRVLEAGDVFGETAIFKGSPRTASVRALTAVTARLVTRQTLEEGLGLEAWTGRFVLALAKRFTDLEEQMEDGERKP